MNVSKRLAVILATITAFIWGLTFLVIKSAMVVIGPMSLGLARFTIASFLLLIPFILDKKLPSLKPRDLPAMAGAGLIGVTLYFLGENNGIKLLSASESSIIIGTIPVLTVLAERLFLKTRLTPGQYAGAAMSAVGVAVIVLESLKLSANPLGYLFMALAAFAWVVYGFMTKTLSGKYTRMEVTFWQSFFGGIGFIPFVFFEKLDWSAVNTSIVLQVLYLAVFGSAAGYFFYITSLDVLGTSVASVFINLIPVVSVIASFFILKERLTVLQMIGGIITIAGVYLANRISRPKASISV